MISTEYPTANAGRSEVDAWVRNEQQHQTEAAVCACGHPRLWHKLHGLAACDRQSCNCAGFEAADGQVPR